MASNIPSELTFSHKRVRITNFSNHQSVDAPFNQTQSVSYQPYGTNGSILTIGIKPNQLSWSYGLNTQAYPTYAGEVIQILSAYIDNVTIEGDVRTYADMELIYKWFIAYMTIATQGVTGSPTLSNILQYDDDPIIMSYPHRSWTLQIRPLSLPTLTYGTDVVVPNWQMEAAVVEDENLQLTQMMNSNIPALVTSQLTKLDANFGNGVENPFNYWSGNYQQFDLNKFLDKASQKTIESLDANNTTQLTDWFHTLVSQYAQGNVDLTESSIPFSKIFTSTTGADISTTVTAGSTSTSTNTGTFGAIPPSAFTPQGSQLGKGGKAENSPMSGPGWNNMFGRCTAISTSRVDQGCDWAGISGPIGAVDDGIITQVYPGATAFSGGPGIVEALANGWFVYYALEDGATIAGGLREGQKVKAGTTIANGLGSGGLEFGFANQATGMQSGGGLLPITPIPAGADHNIATAGGAGFANWVSGTTNY